MDDVERQIALLMHGREAFFENVDKKVDGLQELLAKRPLVLDFDDHVDAVCMGRDLTSSLEVVASRIMDLEEEVRNKIDDMTEWAAFKVMRTKVMEVLDKICPHKTADEVRELVTAAKLSVDTMAVTESMAGDESWISRALGEVRDPPQEEEVGEVADAPPSPPPDSSDSDGDPYACKSGRHCASCCPTDDDDDDVDTDPSR
jgi:hypothetical protein